MKNLNYNLWVYCTETGKFIQEILQIYCATKGCILDELIKEDNMQVYCATTGCILDELIKEDNMQVYCAETSSFKPYILDKKLTNIPKFNILFSYYYIRDLIPYLPYAKNIIVDSGGYSFQTRPIKLNHEQYFKRYKKFIEQHYTNPILKGFFELDIDNMVGYEQVKEYRKELFEITDKIIPVWHKSMGIKEYKKLCNAYDFIAIPCTQDRAIKKENYLKFVKYAHKHNCKVHGLGMLRPTVLNKVPFDTCDGTSWFQASRFGKMNGKKVNSEYILKNRAKLIYIELMNHIRFQKEMYNKWKWYHND